jgi:hypothetical protein
MVSRSLNLRRLTFVLLAAERNHYLAQLPSIQEKLVDILRTDVVSPRVHSEVSRVVRQESVADESGIPLPAGVDVPYLASASDEFLACDPH